MITVKSSAYVTNAALSSSIGSAFLATGAGFGRTIIEALGLGVSPSTFAAGLLFAIAGGWLAMSLQPPEQPKEKLQTLIGALFVGILALWAQPFFGSVIPGIGNFHPVFVMGVGGTAWRPTIMFLSKFSIGAFWK